MKNTKVVILCGGQGSRIRDVSEVLPKPMLPIGSRPILWHIMKLYAHYGFNDFVLCLGYKGWVIKEFFLNYYAKTSDITVNLSGNNPVKFHSANDESNWNITMVETGERAGTGARIFNARKYLEGTKVFCVTYGDGIANLDIKALMDLHKNSSLMGTISGVHPSGRFGEMEISGNMISEFNEKPNVRTGLINGGFMVLNREVLDRYFCSGEDLSLEGGVLEKMVKNKQLGVYKHEGFWQCIDTPREYNLLNAMWDRGEAPWKMWE